jgi:hypothetical protein
MQWLHLPLRRELVRTELYRMRKGKTEFNQEQELMNGT